jgi:hypothetical protein
MKFYLDENLVRENSKFFELALKESWEEGQARVMKLPDIDVEVFAVYSEWLCSRTFSPTSSEFIRRGGSLQLQDARNDQGVSRFGTFPLLIHLYALGNVLIDQDYRDAVTDKFARLAFGLSQKPSWIQSTATRTLLFNKTADDSHLRRLFVRLITSTGACEEYATPEDDPQYLSMLVNALQRKT